MSFDQEFINPALYSFDTKNVAILLWKFQRLWW